MKTLFVVVLFAFINSMSLSQSFYNDFEDDTLQGWKNTDDSTTLLTIEENSPNKYLQKECDGTNSAVGEMAIINSDENYWAGNYFYEVIDTNELHTIDEMLIKNDNDFDLHLRLGFKGQNDYIVVTSEPIIVPALSDWNFYSQSYYLESPLLYNLSVINDTTGMTIFEIYDKVQELFENVIEFKIFHNEEVLYEGETLNGTLQIESIMSFTLLANDSQELSKLIIYPNPINEIMTIKFPSATIAEVVIYNILGEETMSNSISDLSNQIDISYLKSGLYLVSIETETLAITKKIIKL